MRRPFVLAVLLAIAFTSTARAARPSFAYEVVVEGPASLHDVLRDRLGYGWTCAAVARPVGLKLATSVAVVLAQEKGADVPLKRDVRVITSTPDGVDELARRLDASAAQGFGVCGLTMTAPIWGRPGGDYAVVAVLTRTDSAPTGVTYRAVHSTGRRDEWAEVQKAAADGFAVTSVVSRPQPDVSSTSDVVLLAEKTAASRPLTYDKVVGGQRPRAEEGHRQVHRPRLLRPDDVDDDRLDGRCCSPSRSTRPARTSTSTTSRRAPPSWVSASAAPTACCSACTA